MKEIWSRVLHQQSVSDHSDLNTSGLNNGTKAQSLHFFSDHEDNLVKSSNTKDFK